MMNELEKMRQAAMDISRILDKIKQVTEGFRFDKRDDQHFLLVSLHGSMFEMTYACMHMLNIGATTCIPIIVRSMIEALSTMSLIASDKNNIEDVLDAFYSQRYRQAAELMKLKLEDYDMDKLKIISEECRAKSKSIRENRGEPPSISARIERTLGPNFSIAYKMYCSDAHSDLMALESRHVVKDEAGDFGFEIFKESTLRECINAIDVMLCCLLMSTNFISSKVTSRKKSKIKNASHKFKRFKEKYFPKELGGNSRPFEAS